MHVRPEPSLTAVFVYLNLDPCPPIFTCFSLCLQATTDFARRDETRQRLTEQERQERNQQLQKTLTLLVHACSCHDPQCSSTSCRKVRRRAGLLGALRRLRGPGDLCMLHALFLLVAIAVCRGASTSSMLAQTVLLCNSSLAVCCPAGASAVPARRAVPAQGHWRLPAVQEDVVPAQPARQELHHIKLPSAALQVGVLWRVVCWWAGGCFLCVCLAKGFLFQLSNLPFSLCLLRVHCEKRRHHIHRHT